MSHRLPAFLLGFALAGQALAQATSLNLNRIERPWPGGSTGAQALTVGSFVPNHDGSTAVVAIDGALFSSFQPALWNHFAAAGGSGVQRLTTVMARDGAIGGLSTAWDGTDLLAATRVDGLRLLQYSATGFVDAALPNLSDASWAGAIGLASRIEGTGAVRGRYVLGWSPTWVKLSVVDPALGLLPVATFPAPPGVAVHDATLIDWTVGGPPEVAVLLANGTAVLDVNGLPQAWLPRIAGEGRLCSWRRNNAPALSVVCRPTPAANMAVHTHQPGGYYFSGGSFPLATTLTGVLATTIDADVHADLLVSHTGTTRLFVLGTADGPSVNGQNNLRAIHDVATNQLPTPVPSNLVPAVVTDVNRDGLVDLVVASAATTGVVLQLGLLPQMASALQNGGNSEPAEDGVDDAMLMHLDAGLGLVTAIRPDALGGVDTSGLDMVGIRLSLPSAPIPGYVEAWAVVYDVVEDKVAVDSGKPYKFSLMPAAGHTKLDLLVPVEAAASGATWNRFVIEVSLTKAGGKEPLPPSLVFCANHGEELDGETGILAPLPIWALWFWWYTIVGQPAFPLPVLPPSGTGDSTQASRYIGSLANAISPEVLQALAELEQPQTVTGGSTTH